jgi:hypothetical protein
VGTQLSEEAGEAATEPDTDTDSGSESEPEPSGDLDPEPSFRRHPNAWRLWAARAERRRAAGRASGSAAAATASSAVPEHRSAPSKPPQPRTGITISGPELLVGVTHRWSGHGEVELDLLVFRGLSSESAADCFALSPQERTTPVVLR